jgi:hypothetical protein
VTKEEDGEGLIDHGLGLGAEGKCLVEQRAGLPQGLLATLSAMVSAGDMNFHSVRAYPEDSFAYLSLHQAASNSP